MSPKQLAYRLGYLLNQQKPGDVNKQNQLFRITKKGLEVLAEDKTATNAQQNTAIAHQAPISEAYIACTAYELERINCYLIKVDREYVISSQISIKKLRKLSIGDGSGQNIYGLSWDSLEEEIQAALHQEIPNAPLTQKRLLENGDQQQALLNIWQTLITHAKTHVNSALSSKHVSPLSYKMLCEKLPFQLHQNGLASYLYSIEQYCQNKQLPRLDYLVVKNESKLPDGIVATNIDAIRDFHSQLKEIASTLEKSGNGFQAEPGDLKFIHKPRAKKASKKQANYTPLTEEPSLDK